MADGDVQTRKDVDAGGRTDAQGRTDEDEDNAVSTLNLLDSH